MKHYTQVVERFANWDDATWEEITTPYQYQSRTEALSVVGMMLNSPNHDLREFVTEDALIYALFNDGEVLLYIHISHEDAVGDIETPEEISRDFLKAQEAARTYLIRRGVDATDWHDTKIITAMKDYPCGGWLSFYEDTLYFV